MRTIIGYNRTVKLAWLEAVAGLAGTGKSDEEIYLALKEMLKDQLSRNSDAKRGSREKTITLLMKTWVRVPEGLSDFQHRALNLYKTQATSNHLVLHWAMTFTTYPFCKVVADAIGRSFKLQGSATAAQVQRRVRELHGEREAVFRSTRYVIRAFQDWGVLACEGRQGIYKPVAPITIDDVNLARILYEAVLRANGAESVVSQALASCAALFPFNMTHLNFRQVLSDARFEVIRQGLIDDIVKLK